MIEQASLVIGEGNWAVKSDNLLGYKINGGKYYPREMSVVRATTGTRINEDGLVELVPYNLLTYSNTFSNVAWVNTNSTDTSGQSGYDGTANAWLIQSTIASGEAYIRQTISSSTSNTFSIYAKAGTANFLGIYINATSGVDPSAFFNLSTGVVGTTSATATASIESVGNGWYRCLVTYSGTITNIDIYIASSNGSFLSATGDNILIQDAQLVEGSSALDYLPTTDRLDVARIDYSSGSGALLVEPQRTNLLTYSSSFDNAAWDKLNGGTSTIPVVTANYADSPDGTQNADRIQCSADTSSASNYSLVGPSINTTLSATGTFTIYLKSNTSSNQNVLIYWSAGQGQVFSVTPEWQRFTLSNLTAGTAGIRFGTRGGSGFFYTGGDATLDILAYGAQLEVGSYATSYIPTTSASVTRNADGNLTLITPQTLNDFVLFYDGLFFDENVAMTFGSGGNNAWYAAITASINRIVIDLASGRKYEAFNGNLVINQRIKIAIKRASGVFDIFVNGVKLTPGIQVTDTTALSLVSVGWSFSSTFYTQGRINSAAAWQTSLTDAQCQTLTTI